MYYNSDQTNEKRKTLYERTKEQFPDISIPFEIGDKVRLNQEGLNYMFIEADNFWDNVNIYETVYDVGAFEGHSNNILIHKKTGEPLGMTVKFLKYDNIIVRSNAQFYELGDFTPDYQSRIDEAKRKGNERFCQELAKQIKEYETKRLFKGKVRETIMNFYSSNQPSMRRLYFDHQNLELPNIYRDPETILAVLKKIKEYIETSKNNTFASETIIEQFSNEKDIANSFFEKSVLCNVDEATQVTMQINNILREWVLNPYNDKDLPILCNSVLQSYAYEQTKKLQLTIKQRINWVLIKEMTRMEYNKGNKNIEEIMAVCVKKLQSILTKNELTQFIDLIIETITEFTTAESKSNLDLQ